MVMIYGLYIYICIDKGTRWWSPFQVSSLQIRTQLHIFVDMIWSFNQWQVKDPNWHGSRKHQPVYIPSRETRTTCFFCQAKELTVTVDSPWGGRNQQGGFDMDVNADSEEISSRGLGWSLEGWKGGEMRHLVGYNQGFRVSLELVINIQVILEEPNIAQETKGMFCSPISIGSNFKFQPGWFEKLVRELLVRVLFQVYPQVILFGCPFLGIPISCFARIILDHSKPYRWPLRLGAAAESANLWKKIRLQHQLVHLTWCYERKPGWLGYIVFFFK